GLVPRRLEGVGEIGDRGPFDLDAGVAPRGDPALGIALPALGDAETGDEPDPAVDDEALAMVAPQPGERRVEPEGIEPPELHARLLQTRPERLGRFAARAEPILKEPHPDAAGCGGAERGRETVPDAVVREDVAVERDAAAGTFDGAEPGGIVLGRVAQQPDTIAGHERGTRGSRESLLRERAQRRERNGRR